MGKLLQLSLYLAIILGLLACESELEKIKVNEINWKKRAMKNLPSNLISGKTYLSVYSQIYSQTDQRTHNLTATISMRNMSETDSIFLTRAEFFDTHGGSIKEYFEGPIFLRPLETVEIIINEHDEKGGTGGNFMFDWKIKSDGLEPLFEGVMSSTLGQQGLSFLTHGQKISK